MMSQITSMNTSTTSLGFRIEGLIEEEQDWFSKGICLHHFGCEHFREGNNFVRWNSDRDNQENLITTSTDIIANVFLQKIFTSKERTVWVKR